MDKIALIKKLENREKVKGYVYMIARNTAYDLLRKNKYREHKAINEQGKECRDMEFDTKDMMIKKIEHEKLSEYVKKLKPEYKEAIVL